MGIKGEGRYRLAIPPWGNQLFSVGERRCSRRFGARWPAIAGAGIMDHRKSSDIEVLARMAARLAGQNPDQHVKMEYGGVVAFEGPIWRYPDFLQRAEQAYAVLA